MLDLPRLHLRAAFFRLIRSFFHDHGFLEIDSPIRQPVAIPEAQIVPLQAEGQFLQTSPEICMKRLLAQGCENIFQICHCFRKDERGTLHLEEFQMLEWYRSGADYRQLMGDCEELCRFLACELTLLGGDTSPAPFGGMDLQAQWQYLSVSQAFEKYSPLGALEALEADLFDELLVEYVEPHLGVGTPLFLYDYPLALGSLAKAKETDPELVERFELYMCGVEIANGFSELTDEVEQRRRFVAEIAGIQATRGDEVQMPERFLSDIGKIDRAAGIALGLDRLFMQAINGNSLSEVATFTPEDFI